MQHYLWNIILGGMCLTIKNFDPHGNVGQTPNICSLFFLNKSQWMFTKDADISIYIVSLTLKDLVPKPTLHVSSQKATSYMCAHEASL
jgi:hypothetical protein